MSCFNKSKKLKKGFQLNVYADKKRLNMIFKEEEEEKKIEVKVTQA